MKAIHRRTLKTSRIKFYSSSGDRICSWRPHSSRNIWYKRRATIRCWRWSGAWGRSKKPSIISSAISKSRIYYLKRDLGFHFRLETRSRLSYSMLTVPATNVPAFLCLVLHLYLFGWSIGTMSADIWGIFMWCALFVCWYSSNYEILNGGLLLVSIDSNWTKLFRVLVFLFYTVKMHWFYLAFGVVSWDDDIFRCSSSITSIFFSFNTLYR